MRVDYYHTGNDKEERFSLDRIVIEPLPWAGQRVEADRRHESRESISSRSSTRASGRTLYSRGFASIYGEWETTAEAKSMNRTFSESLRFPAVDKPAQVVVKKRDARNAFQEIWTFAVDPADKFIERGARMPAAGSLIKIHEAGDPAEKLDLLMLGDGYTAAERGKFERDARRLVGALFQVSPFKERQKDINVWGLVPAAVQSGISRPSQGIHRRSPLGATYDAFDSERYVLTFENRAFRDIASNAPYDVVEILTNTATYGGGGIYGLYSTVAADSAWAPYVFVHEFGHHLAGLADEYYTSDVAYLPATDRQEPWEPNVTALLDPSTLKWRDLVDAGHAAADAVAEGGVRIALEGHPGTAAPDSRGEQARGRDGRALPRADGAGHGAPRSRRTRRKGRRVRGRELRGARLFPAAGRLHHVHARRGAVLPRVPARHRTDSRSVHRLMIASCERRTAPRSCAAVPRASSRLAQWRRRA